MVTVERTLSPQEQRIAEGCKEALTTEEARNKRPRISRMLEVLRDSPPRACVDVARLYTESLRQTEGLPRILRIAKALENIMNKIDIFIGDDELIVGRCAPGKHGVLYMDTRGHWWEENIESIRTRREGGFILTQEDVRIIKEELLPYWKGKTENEAFLSMLPEDTKRIFYREGDIYSNCGVLDDKGAMRAFPEWITDYEKVLVKGFNGIKREAEERLASLDPLRPDNTYDKMAFLKATTIICGAIVTYAKRHAELARNMAKKEKGEQRKRELLEIAEACDRVPGNPARTFREAIQSHWLTRVALTFETDTTSEGSGRLDQLFYPYYRKDKVEGRITDDEVLELLECHWLNQAQNLPLILLGSTPQKHMSQEAYPHFEMATLGGQTRDGRDATNELSYLILQSKLEFPLNYPDLMVRVHSRSPHQFLVKACECVKEGTGFPKFMNDEDIVPELVSQGATLEEARDYAGSGCTEIKVVNKDTTHPPATGFSLAAALDMALNDGVLRSTCERVRLGVRTGDPRNFATFSDLMNAFRLQVEHMLRHIFIADTIHYLARKETLAAPLHSLLHELCWQQCKDILSEKVEGAIYSEGNFNTNGFGTVIDSLAAIKKLVFDDKQVKIGELIDALETNFEGKEVLRQMCLNAPKYGNNDLYVDSIGKEVEGMIFSFAYKYTNPYGGKLRPLYVPVTAHVMFGSYLGATPNGRRAGEPLSDGISPSQGCDINGPTTTLMSVANIRNRVCEGRDTRLLNMKLSPQSVSGDEGTRNMVALLRAWCDLKIEHIQFNIINIETLRNAQKHPEKYRNLLVRVAGYSAYFVDLTPELQEDIIQRTEHQHLQ